MANYVSKQQFKLNTETDLIAFIDESGDEGFSENSSKWFIVGCILMKYDQYQTARNFLDKFHEESEREWKNIHFKTLQHNRRKDFCSYLAKSNYTVICSCFSKFDLSESEKYLASYPSMYFVGVKNVIERASWVTAQEKMNKVHIMIANRNKVEAKSLQYYLYTTSRRASMNMSYYNKLGNIKMGNQDEYGIKMSDCIASSIFQCLEPHKISKIGDRSYYYICVKDRFYSSNHPKYAGVWRNGFKCTPDNLTLTSIIDSGILTED